MEYFGFIYEWIDSTNGKNYIGSHYGSIDDGYIGSGKLFKRTYSKRPEKFQRKILEYVYKNSKKILLETEQRHLNLINWDKTYNISRFAVAGPGCAKGRIISKKHRQNLSMSQKGKSNIGKIPWNKGLKMGPQSAEHKRKNSESMIGKNKGRKLRPLSEETKRKISEKLKVHWKSKHEI